MSQELTHNGESHHVVSPLVYLVIYLLLLLGTGLTIWASLHNFGAWNIVFTLAIAITQTLLVVLYTMHVRFNSKLLQLTVGSGIFMLLFMFGMILSDYMTRAWGQW